MIRAASFFRGRMRGLFVLGAAAMVLTVSCGERATTDETAVAEEPLQVFAAASLTETFTEIGVKFEEQHGVEVELNYAGSSDLIAQIEQGAPAAVLASADEVNMKRAQEADLLTAESQLFASNTLVIATPPGNPAGIHSLVDVAGDEVLTVVCAPQVPCGAATQEVAETAGVELSPVSEESAVTDVLGKVRSGEADAGLVYRTDAQTAGGDVETIHFEGAEAVVSRYPIGILDDAPDPEVAEDFVEFVLSDQSQRILTDAGFTAP